MNSAADTTATQHPPRHGFHLRIFALACLPILMLSLPSSVAAQDLQAGRYAVPVPVSGYMDGGGSRVDALLCYHEGASYYVTLPHASHGNQERIYQRITPGSAGFMTAFELRLHNEYPGFTRHMGDVQLTVHRRVGGLPGPFEQMRVLDADSIENQLLTVLLDTPFGFTQGEEFYLGLSFLPASSQDTVAYVTAGLGTYTGHSFFISNGQIVWWGDMAGTPFGDMHFCSQVWLVEERAFMQFPWSQLDLGRCKAGDLLDQRLAITNQGTAPLVMQSATVSGDNWSCSLAGPDSLMPPDTLYLDITWHAPAGESSSQSVLVLRSNAANGPERIVPVYAASSTADLLLADWDEWEVGSVQQGDSSAASSRWTSYHGLGRPGPFMGHGAPAPGLDVMDMLVLEGIQVPLGGRVQLRWGQYQRNRAGMVLHALCWRNPVTGAWQQLAEPDLTREPWLGPEGRWITVPWITWQAPVSGRHDLGLLYGGAGASDMWFVDDLELVMLAPLQAPALSIEAAGDGVRLRWNPVLAAQGYRIMRVDCQPPRLLGLTSATLWVHSGAQRLGSAQYQVIAWNDDVVAPWDDQAPARNVAPGEPR